MMAEAHSTRSLRSQKSISSAKTTTRKETSTSLDDSNIDIDLSAKSSRQNFDIKSRCMPFFKRFWKNLGEGESKQQLQPNLYGRPLEEVDPFVFEDTFCVIAKKYGKHYIYRFSATRSLFIFGPLNPIRKIACRIISNQLFDLFIILVILANCVTLAMGTNWEVGTTGIMRVDEAKNQIIDVMEYIFLGIYTVEMTLKIISKGFMFNKFSYLRNSWNLLDFVVVSSGYITIGISQANVKNSQDFDFEFLRTLRVLRAIKTISILPGLRMMINALLSSVVQLLEVMALTLFCLMIFALLALELYMGKLLQKCVLIKNGAEHVKMVSEGSRVKSEITGGPIKPGTPNANRLWWEWVRRHDNWLMRVDDFPKEEYVPCGNDTWSRQCPEGYVCLGNMGENYDDGWTSFDTFFSSMLSTFQLITLDFWERPYDLILSSTTPWSVLFFLVVIFLGSFYLLNLMLAVVAMSYEEEYQQSTQVPLTKHQKLSLTRKASTFSFDDPVKLKVTAMTHYRKRTPSEREMIARTLKNSSLSRRKLRRMKRKNRLTSGDSTAGAGTPNVKSVTASICDESGVDFDSEGGSSLSDEGDSDSGLKQSKVFVGEVVSGQVNPCGVDLPISVTCCSGDKPDVQSTKQSDKKFHGGVAKVGVSVISSVDNDSQNFCIKIEEGEPRDVDGDEGKKRPNLHSAVMTLLGRQVSMDSKSAKDDRKSLESGTPPCSLQIFSVNPCTTASPCLPSRSASIPVDSKDAEMVSHLYSSMSPSLSRQNSTQSLPGAGSSPAKLRKRPSEEFGVEPSAARTIARSTKESISKFLFLLKSKLTPVVTHWAFEIIITSIIIFNTILLASEHHDQPQWLDNVLFVGNHFFTAAFLFEAIIKICALQRDYFRSIWNRFDLFVLAMSFVDSLFESYNIKFNAIRSMRLRFASSCVGCPSSLGNSGSTNKHKCFPGFNSIVREGKSGAIVWIQWIVLKIIFLYAFVLEEICPDVVDTEYLKNKMLMLRVFKLAQSWITMKVLLNIIFSTFGALGNLTLVLLIVLYIFAVLGLQVVGDYYTKKAFNAVDDEDEFPRWNFQNFWYAFMMVFRVICGEWIEPLWDCLKATSRKKDEYKCFFIFLPVLVVGNFIILNLFLALLLNSFDTEELNAQREKELEASGKSDNLLKIVGMLLTKKTKTENGNAGLEPISTASEEVVIQGDSLSFQEIGRGKARFKNAVSKVIIQNRKALAEKVIEQTKSSCSVKEGGEGSRRRSSFALGHREGEDPEFREHKVPGLCVPKKCWEMNCCMFNFLRTRKWKNWDAARGFAIRIVTHPFFEWFILALIFASSITLCFEDVNLDQRKELQEILFYINTTFTFIFVMEMILKWFALGLWKYFTSSWTLLDFFIVGISLVSWYYEMQSRVTGTTRATGSQLAALKALRTLRALRPLRAISRWQGMKIVVNALMFAIPSIFNVLLVCLLFWLIFSIMGVQFFKGKFYRCVENDSGDTVSIEKVKTRQECCNMTSKYSWVNTQPNFDNVFQGYLTLFQVATFEGWIEAMRAAVDSVDVDKQPQRDHSLEYYLFFVIFIVFGAFFTLNLFIGVIIDNFNRLKKKYEGNLLEALLTPSQRHYYTAMKKLGRKKPRKVIKRPTNGFLSIFYDISMSRRFEIAIFVMIFLNMVIMAFEHHNQRQIYVHILSGFNSFFTTIYGLEAIVKIVGLRQYYFTVPWNLFDFCLVIASIVDLAVGDLLGEGFPIPPTMLRIVRVFRIGRVLRLIKAAKGIRKLLFALVVSLPALFNIGALLALITFIYAILGMALFGKIAKNKAIDELFNFETFLRSCLMLLRIMTAAGWNDVLIAMTPEKPLCGTYRKIKCGRPGEGECANVGLAILYMVSYLLISYLIVINMYIAIILENFYEANREEEVGIVEDDLEMFYVRWSRYDPQATQFISFDQLSDFVASLDPPLGIPKPNIVAVVAFNLPIARGNKIHCLDILHALVKHVLGHIDDTEEFRKLQEQMEHKFRKQFPTRKLLDIISSTRVWKMQYNSAVTIQRTWRAYRARKYPPVEVVKSTQTLQSRNSIGGIQAKENQGMLNKMGNLLHLGQSKLQRRRVSMIEANNKPLKSQQSPVFKKTTLKNDSIQDLEAKEHLSDISDSCYASFMPASPVAIPSNIPRPPLTRVEASSFDGQRGSVSPSRLSGGSFDAALTYGNGLNVQRNMGAPVGCSNSPVPSCPSSPSSVKGKSHSVIVQVHHPP